MKAILNIILALAITGYAHAGYVNIKGAPVRLDSEVTGTLPIANGGTNSATALSGSSIMVSNGSAVVQGSAGTSSQVLHGNASGAPTYGAVALGSEVSGQLPLANGGTNKNMTAVNGGVVYSDADSLEVLATDTSGKILKSGGAGAPSWSSETGFAKLSSGVLSASSTVNAGTELTGVAPVANGGTGASTLTANNLIIGNDTSAVSFLAPGTSGNIVTSNGTSFQSSALSSLSIVTTPGAGKEVLVSARVADGSSTTTVSAEDDNFINGNCTNPSGGTYTCTWTSNYWASQPDCWVVPTASTGRYTDMNPSGTTNTTVSLAYQGGPSYVDANFTIWCKGVKN